MQTFAILKSCTSDLLFLCRTALHGQLLHLLELRVAKVQRLGKMYPNNLGLPRPTLLPSLFDVSNARSRMLPSHSPT